MMYKPLSLVISNTSRDLEQGSFLRAFEPILKDGSRNNTPPKSSRQTPVLKLDTRQHDKPVPRQVVKGVENTPAINRPRCIKSYRSDRVAIYDEQQDTFHAYSVTEAISQPGLTFQEAVDWVDDRLVLVGNGMTPGNFTVAMSLVLASWAVAILLISAIIKLIF